MTRTTPVDNFPMWAPTGTKLWAAWAVIGLAAIGFSCSAAVAEEPTELEWVRKPGQTWRTSPVQVLEQLEGYEARPERPILSRFGGHVQGERREATGFFRTENIDGRWWTIDPEGYPYIHMGLTSIRPTRHARSRPFHREAFGSDEVWAERTVDLMRDLGFNEIGRWGRIDLLNPTENRLPYTTSLTFMGSFGRELGITTPSYGHLRYPSSIIPVFHPRFESFAFEYARENLAGMETDPWLVGHFTDNELPVPRDLLTRTLGVDPDDVDLGPNVAAAWEWFRERRGAEAPGADVTAADNIEWLGHVMDRYYEITTAAIRKYGPNHMNLGSRLHGAGAHLEPVLAAAGRHLDIVSINYYNSWDAAPAHLARWTTHSAAPILISEFYVKGEDAAEEFGLSNELGAGWVVRTQKDRGRWYQNFTLGLLRSPHVVGWQYFKYADEADDSNKGILNPRYELYRDLTDAMSALHRNAYALVEYFDGGAD